MRFNEYVYYKYFRRVTAMDTRRPFRPRIDVDQENNQRALFSAADYVLHVVAPSTHDPSLQMRFSEYVQYKYFRCVTATDTRRPFRPHIDVDQENNQRALFSVDEHVLHVFAIVTRSTDDEEARSVPAVLPHRDASEPSSNDMVHFQRNDPEEALHVSGRSSIDGAGEWRMTVCWRSPPFAPLRN